jgi:hypothetical protein
MRVCVCNIIHGWLVSDLSTETNVKTVHAVFYLPLASFVHLQGGAVGRATGTATGAASSAATARRFGGLFHVTDWLPTLYAMAGGECCRKLNSKQLP